MGWSNFPENWETDAPQIEILDIDRVPTELTVGTKYHCTWASSKGMVWVFNCKTIYISKKVNSLTIN